MSFLTHKILKQNKKNIRKFNHKFRDAKMFKQNTKSGIAHYEQLISKPILFVENLCKKYPHKKKLTINNISFNVYPGQFHAFIGANGAGKTTTIKSLIGAYARWTGTILINGKKNTSIEAKNDLGYIPENARFPKRMSCYSYLVWMAKLSGLKNIQAKRFAITRLNELNMWNLRRKNPNLFSSGQKKKILLAQALINNPKILIMDEPAANLDPKARLDLYETLSKLAQKGKAIFISSHVLAELDKYANAATILDGGQIVFTGSTKELFEKYKNDKIQINVSNNQKMNLFLKDNGFVYEFDEFNNKFILDIKNQEQEKKLFNFFKSNDSIELLSFNKSINHLDDIYKKLVKYGSVDTMEIK